MTSIQEFDPSNLQIWTSRLSKVIVRQTQPKFFTCTPLRGWVVRFAQLAETVTYTSDISDW